MLTPPCSVIETLAKRRDQDYLKTHHSSMDVFPSSSLHGCSVWTSAVDTTFFISILWLAINKTRLRKHLEEYFHSFSQWRISDMLPWMKGITWSSKQFAIAQISPLISGGRDIIKMIYITLLSRDHPSELVMMEDLAQADIKISSLRENPRTTMA